MARVNNNFTNEIFYDRKFVLLELYAFYFVVVSHPNLNLDRYNLPKRLFVNFSLLPDLFPRIYDTFF